MIPKTILAGHWGTLSPPASGTVSTDTATRLHNKTSLKLALSGGSSRVAVANRGLGNAGLVFHAGQPYTASLWASSAAGAEARPSLIPSLCTHFTRAGIEWRR